MTAGGHGAELRGHGQRVLFDRCLARVNVGEVAVLQQVNDLDQRAFHVQAERGHDLPRWQREQPDPGCGQLRRVLPAAEPQRLRRGWLIRSSTGTPTPTPTPSLKMAHASFQLPAMSRRVAKSIQMSTTAMGCRKTDQELENLLHCLNLLGAGVSAVRPFRPWLLRTP